MGEWGQGGGSEMYKVTAGWARVEEWLGGWGLDGWVRDGSDR